MSDEILSQLDRLEAGQSSMQAEIGELRGEVGGLRSELGDLRAETRKNHSDALALIGQVETRLEGEITSLRREQTDAFGHVLMLIEEIRDHTRGLPEQRRRLKKILDFVSKNALEPEAYEEIKPDIAAL